MIQQVDGEAFSDSAVRPAKSPATQSNLDRSQQSLLALIHGDK